jgi:hypothetical protein
MLSYGLFQGVAMRIQNTLHYRVAVPLLCTLLMSCSNPDNTLPMAEKVAGNFYQAVKNKDFEKAASYFQDTPNDPRGRWLAELRLNNEKLGGLESYKLVDKEVDTVYSGTRYILVYRTKYAKRTARETLILFTGVSTFSGDNTKGMELQGMVVKPDRA